MQIEDCLDMHRKKKIPTGYIVKVEPFFEGTLCMLIILFYSFYFYEFKKSSSSIIFSQETYLEYEVQSICSQISSLGSAIIDNSLTCSISDSC